MVATLFVLNICCVLSGLLVCISAITLASVSPSASPADLQSTKSSFNATQGLPSEGNYSGVEVTSSTSAVLSNNRNSSVGVKTSWRTITQQTSRKLNPKALLSPQLTLDKIYLFIDTVNNIMNGNTSATKFNRMMQAYGALYTSLGAQALNNFLNMWVSVFTVLDAVANIFRAYETRFLNVRNENHQHPPEPPNPLEDLQASLDDVNSQVEVVSDLFQTLARMGEYDDTERRGQSEAEPAQTFKRAGSLHKRQDNTKSDHANENSEQEAKDSINIKGRVNIQKDYLPINPSQLETNRRLFYPPNSGGISNTGIPYYSTTGNPVGRYSRQNQRPKTTNTQQQPSNLELYPALRSHIRSRRSYVDYDYGIDRFVYVMRKMNNVLNSNTNNRQLNKFTKSFNNLFASNGLIAFNTFYTLLASFWTVIDAVTNIFRFNEARIRDGIQRNQDQNKPDLLANLQTQLGDTNANLDEVVQLVTTMDEAAARLETLTDDEFDRSGVKKKKKKSKKHGSRRRKPSRPTTPQPTITRHSNNPVTIGSYSGTRNPSLIPSKAGAINHHIIQPASTRDRWQPIHYKSPIMIPHQSSHAGNISNNPNNSLPSSTNATQSNNFNAVKHSSSAAVGPDRINPQHSSIPANRYAISYDQHRRSNQHQQSSFEINRQSNDRTKYNSWVGLSTDDNKPVANNTGRV